MKLSNSVVWNLFDNAIGEPIVLKLSNAGLSASASYKRLKNLKVLSALQKDIAEARDEIIKKYGKEKDGVVGIDGEDAENINKFHNDFNEILSKEEEVEIKKFTLDELDGKIDLTNREFALLSFMIEGMEDEEVKEEN